MVAAGHLKGQMPCIMDALESPSDASARLAKDKDNSTLYQPISPVSIPPCCWCITWLSSPHILGQLNTHH
jgi:hypothetical protein